MHEPTRLLAHDKSVMNFLSYLAGAVDGDGSIDLLRRAPAGCVYTPRLRLSANDAPEARALYFRLATTLGGAVQLPTATGRATVTWTVSGRRAAAVLQLLYPWLRLKRSDAAVALRVEAWRAQWLFWTQYRAGRVAVPDSRIIELLGAVATTFGRPARGRRRPLFEGEAKACMDRLDLLGAPSLPASLTSDWLTGPDTARRSRLTGSLPLVSAPRATEVADALDPFTQITSRNAQDEALWWYTAALYDAEGCTPLCRGKQLRFEVRIGQDDSGAFRNFAAEVLGRVGGGYVSGTRRSLAVNLIFTSAAGLGFVTEILHRSQLRRYELQLAQYLFASIVYSGNALFTRDLADACHAVLKQRRLSRRRDGRDRPVVASQPELPGGLDLGRRVLDHPDRPSPTVRTAPQFAHSLLVTRTADESHLRHLQALLSAAGTRCARSHEGRIYGLLAQNRGAWVPHEILMGDGDARCTEMSLPVHVKNLRELLSEAGSNERIENRRRVGWRLAS